MNTIDLYTALKITKSLDKDEIYVKHPGQMNCDAEKVLLKEIQKEWQLHDIPVFEIDIHWVDYDKTAFLFTIVR